MCSSVARGQSLLSRSAPVPVSPRERGRLRSGGLPPACSRGASPLGSAHRAVMVAKRGSDEHRCSSGAMTSRAGVGCMRGLGKLIYSSIFSTNTDKYFSVNSEAFPNNCVYRVMSNTYLSNSRNSSLAILSSANKLLYEIY